MPPRQAGPRRAYNIVWSVLTLLASIGSLVVLVRYTQSTEAGQARDQAAMDTIDADTETVRGMLSWLGYISIGTTALALVFCIGLALLRRRFAVAAGAAIIVAGANVTTQLVKRVFVERADFGYLSVPSLPSGHTTVVVSIVLAAMLIAPHGLRLAISLFGSILVTLAGASTVVAGWHRPADVFAALLVSLAWGALVVLVLSIRQAGSATAGTSTHTVLSLFGAAAAGVLLVFAGVRPEDGWGGLGDATVVLGSMGFASAGTVGLFARLSAPHSA